MPMEALYIEATKQFPEILFRPDGQLRITGRLINDHLQGFFHPLFLWIDKANCANVQIDIELEYLNTPGSFHLAELIRRIEANKSFKKIEIIWHYEEDDEEHYDLGSFIEHKMKRAKFKFMSHAEDGMVNE